METQAVRGQGGSTCQALCGAQIIGAVGWFAGFWRGKDASGVCVALGINTQWVLLPQQEYLFPHKQARCTSLLSSVFQVNSQQISVSTFPTSHLPSGRIQLEKKKNPILLVFESSSSLPSPSSPSSLVPASWRRKEHINPKTALQPFLPYLPWGANWNWIRQGYQVCSLW